MVAAPLWATEAAASAGSREEDLSAMFWTWGRALDGGKLRGPQGEQESPCSNDREQSHQCLRLEKTPGLVQWSGEAGGGGSGR